MTHLAKLDLSGEIININGQANVHMSLVCGISDKMRSLVEEKKTQAEATSGRGLEQGYSPIVLSLFGPNGLPTTWFSRKAIHEGAAKLWSGFLYGQSMVIPQHKWSADHAARKGCWEYLVLLDISNFGRQYDHVAAVDASLDAIRELLVQDANLYWPELLSLNVLRDNPFIRQLLQDFVVYGRHGDRYVERCSGTPAMSSERQGNFLRFANDLCVMFIRKAQDEVDGVPLPDLMERCRYHTHVGKGLPCYLDVSVT